MREQASGKESGDLARFEKRISLMDNRILISERKYLGRGKTREIKVANKTIVIVVMLMRDFVFGLCLFVMALLGSELRDDMLNGMHRLERH